MRWLDAPRLRWRLWSRSAGRRLRAIFQGPAVEDPVRRRVYALYERAHAHGREALTARQHLVLAAWDARGIIGNGGFRYLLDGDLPLRPIAEGFRALGFDAAALACERVMAAVAAAPGLTDRARRVAVRARPADAFQAEDAVVFAVRAAALERAIGDFMRRHPRDFPGLPVAGEPGLDG